MTIKGIEPELNRMSAAYQEELSELRRIHQSQIEEIEATWHRRMASVRDKMDAEREQAVVTERENARNRYVFMSVLWQFFSTNTVNLRACEWLLTDTLKMSVT